MQPGCRHSFYSGAVGRGFALAPEPHSEWSEREGDEEDIGQIKRRQRKARGEERIHKGWGSGKLIRVVQEQWKVYKRWGRSWCEDGAKKESRKEERRDTWMIAQMLSFHPNVKLIFSGSFKKALKISKTVKVNFQFPILTPTILLLKHLSKKQKQKKSHNEVNVLTIKGGRLWERVSKIKLIFNLDFRSQKEKSGPSLTDLGVAFLARVQQALYTSDNRNIWTFPWEFCGQKLNSDLFSSDAKNFQKNTFCHQINIAHCKYLSFLTK